MYNRLPLRWTSLPLALLMLLQALVATPAYGLSGGPTQPEFQQTSVVGADDLVDPFTGDFNYSIPLFEIGGYPINLTYTSDHKMEEEASWVGFGWTLNPGAISRQVRGLPDDFRGDTIVHRGHVRDNVTTGITPGARVEILGAFGVSSALDFSYNNYGGYSLDRSYSPSINVLKAISKLSGLSETSLLGSPRKKLGEYTREAAYNTNISASFSTRSGLQAVSFGTQLQKFTGNASYSYSSGGFTYTPVGDLPRATFAGTFQYNVGPKGEFFSTFLTTLTGYRVRQSLAQNSVQQRSYGYLHLDGAANDRSAIMDYNVEKGGVIDENSPRLSMPYGTPDVFSVTGSGMSGQIEVTRNDLGAFRPAYVKSTTIAPKIGTEFGGGNLVHAGIDVDAVFTQSRRGEWDDLNSLGENLAFEANQGKKEAVYMRMLGDRTAHTGREWFEAIGNEHPLMAPVSRRLEKVALSSSLISKPSINSSQVTTNLGYPRSSVFRTRRPRANMITYLSALEAVHLGSTPGLKRYPRLTEQSDLAELDSLPTLNRLDREVGRKSHHLSEIGITSTSGQRFVYGLPVYNTLKEESSFNVSGLRTAASANQNGPSFGMVSYERDREAVTIRNRRGMDQYFDQIVTGPHPTAHLLTQVLSPDYTDRSGDGPTLDDPGTYVKIGYAPLHSSEGSRKPNTAIGWRTPMGEYQAVYNEGNLADTQDDKASFVYGEKEIYYVHHMDSKTHRAVFFTSDRYDAKPVNRDGIVQQNGPKLQKLDQIRVYTLAELNERGTDAEPLKTVHFTYKPAGAAGEVSGNLINSDAGKLTLHSVSFTYTDNERGKQNPYIFDYKTQIIERDGSTEKVVYRPFMTDRWGTQRAPITDFDLDPTVFPYANQDSFAAAQYCDIGNLTRIQLPSGAEIRVDYEPDAYAYVQDKRAGRMYRLLGFSEGFDADNLSANTATTELYSPRLGLGRPKLYTYIDVNSIPRTPAGELPDEETLRRLYLEDVDQLYYHARVQLRGDMQSDERIRGYGEFDKDFIAAIPGNAEGGQGDVLVLKLKSVNRDDQETRKSNALHPITYTALDKMRSELPQILYNSAPKNGEIDPFSMLAFLAQEGVNLRNYYARRTSKGDGDARLIRPEASFIRLAEPTFEKYGDGSRVASVTLEDNWLIEPADEQPRRHATSYVKTYDYTIKDPLTKRRISSGVAANEPMAGKEEMLLVNQEKSFDINYLASDNAYYNESPVGLQFLPGPQVGYAQVTMTMTLNERYQQSKPGNTVYKYYTARDFPVITAITNPDRARVRPLPQLLFVYSRLRDRLAVSQGFSIQTNDMHGKMESTKEYGYDGELISSTVYNYSELSSDAESGNRRLNGYLDVVSPPSENRGREAIATREELGLDVDLWVETTKEESSAIGGGGHINAELSWYPPFFTPVGVFTYPNITEAKTSLQTATFTKLVRRYGILESVEVTNNGSSLTTTNHRWDALTGTPVLTSTENEFDQPVYSQTLPAYWMAEQAGMGPAYLTQNVELREASVVNGRINYAGGAQFDQNVDLHPGDEVFVYFPVAISFPIRHRFYAISKGDSTLLIDELGKRANSTNIDSLSLRIVRSGNRNMLAASAGQTTSLSAPSNPVGYWDATPTSGTLLSSSAMEYSEDWGNQCDSITAYSFGTPQDSTKTDTPPDPDPGGGECDDLIQRVNNWIPEYGIGANGDACEIKGVDWLSDVDRLEDCGLCMELFKKYARQKLIDGIGRYGTCTESNNFSSFESTTAQEELINSCDFVRRNLFGHLAGADVLLSLIYTSNVEIGCEDRTGNGEILCENSGTTARTLRVVQQPDCFPWQKDGDQNPYLTGRRGNWRPAASYVAQQARRSSSRVYPEGGATTDARDNDYGQPLLYRDGTFPDYLPFWHRGRKLNGGDSHQLTNRILRYDDHGHELETQDALGIASGAQYGFGQQLPTAVAQNALTTDVGYDSFEDYLYDRGEGTERWRRHFGMLGEEADPDLYENGPLRPVAHTGKYSFQTRNGQESLSQRYATYGCNDEVVTCPEEQACPCVNGFRPRTDQRYLVSAWVGTDYSLDFGLSPAKLPEATDDGNSPANSIQLTVRATNGSGVVTGSVSAYPSGPIVEGWQQVQLEFDPPGNAAEIEIILSPPSSANAGTSYRYFFDDVRIQPYEADMTTYAYDPTTLRLMAQLDDRGYAVFYEYDDEGMLVRQKRETERGIMTITEQHTNLAPVAGNK